MPKRVYTPDQKKLVRRLLLLHQGNVPIVQNLTGYPKRTIHNWRQQWNDDYELFTDALAQKLLARANADATRQHGSNLGGDCDSALAQETDPFAQYAQLRNILMRHAMTLANNLLLGDRFVNQRVYALTRLLDRIIALDETLPDLQPEQTIRFEYSYDDAIHNIPPWDGVNTYQGAKQYNERYLLGMKQRMDEQLAEQFPDEVADDPIFPQSAEADGAGAL